MELFEQVLLRLFLKEVAAYSINVNNRKGSCY